MIELEIFAFLLNSSLQSSQILISYLQNKKRGSLTKLGLVQGQRLMWKKERQLCINTCFIGDFYASLNKVFNAFTQAKQQTVTMNHYTQKLSYIYILSYFRKIYDKVYMFFSCDAFCLLGLHGTKVKKKKNVKNITFGQRIPKGQNTQKTFYTYRFS